MLRFTTEKISIFIYNFMDFYFRKRAREEEIEAAEKAKREREWQKNFEVCSSVKMATNFKMENGD